MIFRKSYSYQRFPAWTSNTSVLKKVPLPALYSVGTGGEVGGGEADHMPSSSVTVNCVCVAVPLFSLMHSWCMHYFILC